ncbi:hypothetical protein I4U23_003859 [Adineta vaga]|nr:hypothetical protein I4U23_003859 [Adineta vaga]
MALYNSIYGILLAGFVPRLLMLIFSLLIYRNLKMKQIRRQHQIPPLGTITPATIQIRRRQIKDQEVLAMLLIQVFICVSSTNLYAINLICSVLAMNDVANKSNERKSIEVFASFIASRLFRKKLKLMIGHFCNGGRYWLWIENYNGSNTASNAIVTARGITQPEIT